MDNQIQWRTNFQQLMINKDKQIKIMQKLKKSASEKLLINSYDQYENEEYQFVDAYAAPATIRVKV